MIKVIVNLNVSIKRVALVSLSLPLGLYGVYLAQPKVTSAHNKRMLRKNFRCAPIFRKCGR
jgi:hypothetical protein